MIRAVAVVLAGGAARRMGGGDKPLRLLRGRPMLEHVFAALDVAPVAISANGDPARFARFGLPVLPDGEFADQGPLAGLLAGLRWAAQQDADVLLTVPGDVPFLPPHLAAMLAPAPACAVSEGQPHHLVALWRVADAPTLELVLRETKLRSVSGFAKRIGMRYVEIAKQDPLWFENVNTPEDLQRLEAPERPAGTG